MLIIDRPAGVQHELPQRHDIGALDNECSHCGARHFRSERTRTGDRHFTTCCNNGLTTVSGDRVLQPAPELLMSFLVDDSQDGRNFRNECRRYNSSLAFAAFSTDLNQRRLPGAGPRVFSVHGQVYHRITNDVVRNDDRQPRYCELYFIESETANRIRMEHADRHRVLENLMTALDTMLREINPYARARR